MADPIFWNGNEPSDWLASCGRQLLTLHIEIFLVT